MPLDPTPTNPRSSRISGRLFGWTHKVASAARRFHWAPVVVAAVVIALICAPLYFWNRESAYRNRHGQVTAVSAGHWQTTVSSVQDNKAVILYFHLAGQPSLQGSIVRHFAWDYARQVKVFSVDLSQPENAAIAARFGLRRYPSFVAIYKGKTIRRFDGAPANRRDLRRLLRLVGAW